MKIKESIKQFRKDFFESNDKRQLIKNYVGDAISEHSTVQKRNEAKQKLDILLSDRRTNALVRHATKGDAELQGNLNSVMGNFGYDKSANGLHRRLQDNKALASKNLQTYLDKNKELNKEDLQTDCKNTIRSNLKKISEFTFGDRDSYKSAISALSQVSDARNNILWHEENQVNPNEKPGSKHLIRDARFAKRPQDETPEVYAMQYLNLARTAEKLIDLESTRTPDERNAAKAVIRESVKDLLSGIADGSITSHKAVNVKKRTSFLNAVLDSAGIDGAADKLASSKDFQFDEETRHITTIHMGKDKDNKEKICAEIEVAGLGTIPAIKAMYQAIKERKEFILEGINKEDLEAILIVPLTDVDHNGTKYSMSWFNDQTPLNKKLIIDNIEKIADGNHIIPNQLIEILPGAKNNYSKSTFVANDQGELVEKLSTMHNGAPAFLGKGNIAQITQLQIEQLQALSGNKISMNILNSKAGYSKDEDDIVNLTNQGAKVSGNSCSVTPFNPFRHIAATDYSDFDKAFKEVARVTEKMKLQSLTKCLKQGSKASRRDLTKARAELETLNTDLKDSFSHALAAIKLMQEIRTPANDRNNRNATLAAEMKNFSYSAGEGAILLKASELKIYYDADTVVTNCKSGIDRTGTEETLASAIAIEDALGKTNAKDNFLAQTASKNANFISGHSAGGTFGGDGVKPETSIAFPKDRFGVRARKVKGIELGDKNSAASLLSRESANGNKGKDHEATREEFIKDFKDDKTAEYGEKLNNLHKKAQKKFAKKAEKIKHKALKKSVGTSDYLKQAIAFSKIDRGILRTIGKCLKYIANPVARQVPSNTLNQRGSVKNGDIGTGL